MDKDTFIFLFMILIILGIIIYHINNLKSKNITEGMTDGVSGIDNEALRNIASIYNKKKLVVDDLHVTGKARIDGNATFNKSPTFNSQLYIDLKNHEYGDAINFRNSKTQAATINWINNNKELSKKNRVRSFNGTNWNNYDNKRYFFNLQNVGLNINKNNNHNDYNNGLRIDGKHTIYENQDKLHISPKSYSDPPLFELPTNYKGTPVFRASGLAYTDKNNVNPYVELENQGKTTSNINNFIKNDPDRTKNLIYLGGTTSDHYNAYRLTAGYRHSKRNNQWFPGSVVPHGSNKSKEFWIRGNNNNIKNKFSKDHNNSPIYTDEKKSNVWGSGSK